MSAISQSHLSQPHSGWTLIAGSGGGEGLSVSGRRGNLQSHVRAIHVIYFIYFLRTCAVTHSLSVVFPSGESGKNVCACLFSGEHLGADVPGVFSPGDDQHGSLHHHGKKKQKKKQNSFIFVILCIYSNLQTFLFEDDKHKLSPIIPAIHMGLGCPRRRMNK